MRRLRLVPVFAGLVVLGAAGAHAAFSSHTAVSQTMHAVVHEDNTFTLTFDDGTAVGNQSRPMPTIPAGTYTIRVVDDATSHNFHLTGPGVEQLTGLGETVSPTWTVTFQPGSNYHFECDNHPDFMYGDFNTSGGSGGGSSGGSSSGGSSSGGSSSGGSSSGGKTSSGGGSQASALLGTLSGAVGPAGRLTLKLGGKPVTKIKSGRYKITVADKAPKRGFVLIRQGGATTTVTGVSFVGTRSVTITLPAGKWTFASPAGSKSPSAFTVTS